MTIQLTDIAFGEADDHTENLLFEPGTGRVPPAIAEDAAAAFGILITSDPGDLTRRHFGDSQEPLDPVLVRPGELHPASRRAELAQVVAEDWDLPEDCILTSSFGFPPLPNPDPAAAQAVFEHAKDLCGHPVFWLPADVITVDHPNDEHPDIRIIRLWLEITARGFGDYTTGNYRNAITSRGFDLDNPTLIEALISRAHGQPVPLLDQFVLPPTPMVVPGAPRWMWALAEATAWVREFAPAALAVEVEALNHHVVATIDKVQGVSATTLMATLFDPAAQAWFGEQRTAQSDQRLRDATYNALAAAHATTNDLVDLAASADARRHRTLFIADDTVDAALEEGLDQAQASFEICVYGADVIFERLFASTDDQRDHHLTELWNLLATHFTALLAWGTEVADGWASAGPVAIDEVDIAKALPSSVDVDVPVELRVFSDDTLPD